MSIDLGNEPAGSPPTIAQQAQIRSALGINDPTLDSDTTGEPVGSDSVSNMVSLTQAQYNTALADSPATIKTTTLYIIKP